MATAAERRFTALRKRLDQIGYRQPLGLESLPLVEKLFGDLLHTTESLKVAKQQLAKHKQEKNIWEQHVEPYQADNARVIQENNELHQQLIRVKENSEQRQRELKAILRRLEHENTDLKFLNTQYLQRLRTQEKESDKKTEKILELQDKNFQAVIQTPGGKKKNIPFRRQRMEIDCTLPESNATTRGDASLSQTLPSKPQDPYVADLLQVADQRMAQLQALVEQGNREKEKLQDSIQSMRKLIENREEEIERLTLMLKGGRPAEALAAEGIRQSRERMVAHLNIQVDFLQKASHELEKKLAGSEEEKGRLEERVTELGAKNARICSELQEIGDLVKQTEQERVLSEQQLKQKITQLEAEQTVQGSKDKELERLEAEKESLLEDNQRMAALLADSEGDRQEVGGLLERLSQERKSFQRQVDDFKAREANLQRQLAELESEAAAPCPSHETVPAVEVRKLRKQRDDLKNAICNFETELTTIQRDTKTLTEDRDNFKLLYEQVNEELMRHKHESRSPTGAGAAVVRRVEGERDHALMELRQKKTECRSLQDRLKSLQDTQQHDLSTLEDKVAELKVQLGETCMEREELLERLASGKKLLGSVETELQSSTAALSAANSELVQQRSKVSQLQALVEASERTRQQQQKGIRMQAADVLSAQSTVSSLNSKIAQMTHELKEKDVKISELRQALTLLDQDHDRLVGQTDKKDEAIASLTTELEQKQASVKGMEGKVAELRAELSQLEAGQRARVLEVSTVSTELDAVREELQSARDSAMALTTQISQLRNDLATMTKENQAVHGELQRAVEEKASLRQKVEEYAETLSRYEEAISLKEQEKMELVQSYNGLNSQAEQLNTTVREMQDTLSETKSELLALSQEKKKVEEALELQSCEIHALRTYEQQLSNMTHALSKMEAALRQEQEEKKALVTDLEVTRELCVQLDKSKESLSTQLSTCTLHYDELQSQLGDMKAEGELLKVQLNMERKSTEQLQGLISSEREKEFRTHMQGKEKDEEVLHLRKLVTKLEADRLTLADQTRKLRADTAVQSEALQRLKSELTAEKFQKEHLKQQIEIQRSSLTLLTSSSLHANTRTPSPPPREATPKPELPPEPALSSPTSTQPDSHDSQEEGEGEGLHSRQVRHMVTTSANIVEQLLHTSASSAASPSPALHSFISPSKK